MLQHPLWTVTEHIDIVEAKAGVSPEPGACLAFTTPGKLFEFLSANEHGKWKLEMAADHVGLIALIADLHRSGIGALHIDRDIDGTGGVNVTLDDLMKFARSLVHA